jgi:hypothetical protein
VETNAKRYRALISAFVAGSISVAAFDEQFLRTFKSEPEGMDGELFGILDRLFGAVDAYWHECNPGEESAFLISEATLRREATVALERLDRFTRRDLVGRSTA